MGTACMCHRLNCFVYYMHLPAIQLCVCNNALSKVSSVHCIAVNIDRFSTMY